MNALYFIAALAFASFAMLMFIGLVWASLVRCKKCGGWCGDDRDECVQNQAGKLSVSAKLWHYRFEDCTPSERDRDYKHAIKFWESRVKKHSNSDGCTGCFNESESELLKWSSHEQNRREKGL